MSVPHLLGERRAAGLARQHDLDAGRAGKRGQALGLGRLARALTALEGYELSTRHRPCAAIGRRVPASYRAQRNAICTRVSRPRRITPPAGTSSAATRGTSLTACEGVVIRSCATTSPLAMGAFSGAL